MNKNILPIALLALVAACDGTPVEQVAETAAPRVILIIGDGMDDQQITIARNYLVGMNGTLNLDGMPYRGMVQVQTVQEDDPSVPDYVGDSASGATSMATGVPTSEGRIATAANTNARLETIMEMAMAAGMRTGIVTTSRVTDATPSSFIAHMSNRYCEAPRGMVRIDEVVPQDSTDCSSEFIANGGPGSIVEQIANSEIDVYVGGGAGRFNDIVEGSDTTTIREAAIANGFTIIEDAAELTGEIGPGKVLGLFANGHLPERMRGKVAQYIERKDGVPVWPEPFSCEPNPDFGDMPSLAEMTGAALARLDNDAGFMLMIESASIDKAAHYWRVCGHIGEMEQLDETVAVALDYAKEHPETLVLVTADHGQPAQMIPNISGLALQNHAPTGRFARV
ncbi:MAG: alkaline phosphatase, partial [Gammaproteobacteria bacterium]|nr:alkaline phosphatase [Gammaproteobacteria bacterium]